MFSQDVSIVLSFVAGLTSFISPCVLPIVPGYLSFISGVSLDDMQAAGANRTNTRRVLIASLAFVLGFSTVFVLLGASASLIGGFLKTNQTLLSRIAGVVIIIFGLHMTGLVKIPFLTYEKRFQTREKPISLLGAYVVGLAFAFGWTPCIGPILASILTLAAAQQTLWRGVLLLVFYSLGLGLPFLLAAVGLSAFFGFMKGFRRHLHTVEVISGALMIGAGLLVLTGSLSLLSRFFSRWLPNVG
jgi:cytochrome c-type biogenesis protein